MNPYESVSMIYGFMLTVFFLLFFDFLQ